jgi:pimeloyl-ACP methyl ester carboxylesterase
MGHSGGGPHALACAALLPDRVVGVVVGASMAPFDAEGLDWFAGMGETSAATLRAAAAGRAAREAHVSKGGPDFTPDDWDTLEGPWAWLMTVVEPAIAAGPAPAIDDDLAYVAPWGFDPTTITAPMLVLHGADDKTIPCTHGEWLATHCPTAELRVRPGGHLTILEETHDALAWLRKVWP